MAMSYILYFGLLLLCWLFAFWADRYNNKKCVWLIVLLLAFVSGMRAFSVGIDTAGYVNSFRLIQIGAFRYAYGLEETFKYICFVFLRIIPNYTALLTFFALIIHGLIIWRLWDFRKVSSYSTMVACYYMGFFFMSLNTMRQFCAIAIVFYATRYLVKHQIFRYILFIVLAFLFHQSSIIGLALLGFELLRWRELSRIKKALFMGVLALLPVMDYYVLQALSRYGDYLAEQNTDIGIMVPIKFLFLMVTAVFVFVIYGRMNHFEDWDKLNSENRNDILLCAGSYFVGVCLIFASYFIPIMNRVGWYFVIYECIYMGMLIKTRNILHKCIFIWCAVIIVGYGFITAMTHNSQGTMPYLFVWQ
ncbi:MAG: EpsG family protein [Ruminococcaceae bacterium]|nr:EpsG family protein [Oscillospiraceae bacterium]